ncbi:MAG TPA: sensor domain-containing diguanylate cyclase [Steroidobacteraceae bacterium]|nr:sensor domain-containing diguanylate cyclase [Steroidobacteraceae bacterium]
MTTTVESRNSGAQALRLLAFARLPANQLPAGQPVEEVQPTSLLRDCMMGLIDATPGVVMLTNTRGRLLYMNGTGRAMLGIDRSADLLPRKAFEVYSAESRERLLAEVVPACLSHGSWRGEMTLVDSTRLEIPVSQLMLAHRTRVPGAGEMTLLSSIAWDIREMKQVEQQLRHEATHDALTGLPNRAMLMERLERALRVAEWNRTPLAVMFLDLDGFKQLNDSRGHERANKLLRALGQRLKGHVRAQDMVARYGGDEFVLLFTDLAATEDANRLVQQVRAALDEPFMVDQEAVRLTASIGVACYPRDGRDAGALLQHADGEMYRHKGQMKAAS